MERAIRGLRRARAFTPLAALALALALAVTPAWATFPGGNGRIAFTSFRDGPLEVYSMEPDGSDQKRLTVGGGSSPAWSPDGGRIAFVRNGQIWLMDANGENAHQITTSAVNKQDLSWSPDGARIAFSNFDDVWIVDSDGTNAHALQISGPQQQPAWSPDGTRIAFVEAALRTIWVMGADGGNPHPITTPPTDSSDKTPTWSPDGLSIAFSRDFDDGDVTIEDDIYIVSSGGGTATSLMNNDPVRDTTPAWSPDGGQIAFESRVTSGQTQIATLTIGGGYVVRTSVGGNLEPDWQPRCPDVKVGFAVAKGCFASVPGQPGDFSTDQTAWVGGFHVQPRPGGRLVLHTSGSVPTLAAEGLGVDVVFSGVATSMPVALIPVAVPGISLDVGGIGSLEQAMFNLPLSGSFKVDWSADGRSSTIEMGVTVKEKLIKTIGLLEPVVADDFDAKLKATQANGSGVKVDSASLAIPKLSLTLPGTSYAALFGVGTKLGLAGASLSAERVDDKWKFSGAGAITFPYGPQQITLGGTAVVFDGALTGFGVKIAGFNTPLGQTGLFLQSLDGGAVWSPKFGLDLGATATLGPKPAGTDVKLFELVGRLRILASVSSCPQGATWAELSLSGNIVALERSGIGKGKFEGVSCLVGEAWVEKGTLDISVSVGETEDVAGAKGTFDGWLNDSGAELKGSATIQLPALPDIGGTGIVSTNGYAFCANLSFFQGGFGSSWTGQSALFAGCDLSPWSVPVLASAAASSPRKLQVPGGLPVVGFAAVGSKRAPRVQISAPGGKVITTGAKGLRSRDIVIVPVDAAHRTYVFVRRPRAGTWTIMPLPGQLLRKVERARGLPKPNVKARVRRVKGKYRLTYRIRPIAGQTVQFVERTKEGAAHPLGRPTRRRSGTITFKPTTSTTPTHTIQAFVTQNKLPRARLKATTFKTP